MACDAIHGHLLLLVAPHTVSHGEVYSSDRYGLLSHVAVTLGAGDARADMRRMIELDVGRGIEIVDPLPRDIFAPRGIGGHFLDFGFVGGDHLMASHAETGAWDASVGAFIDPRVAVGALHVVRQVDLVRVRDGLHGRRPAVEELPK